MFSYKAVTYSLRLVLFMAVVVWIFPAASHAGQIDIKKDRALFSMEFRDADIKDVLRAVGQASNLNMIVGDNVSGQVSLSLKDVDLLDAFEAVLKTKGLTYVREGSIIRVVSASEARDQDMETRAFVLGYASGKDVLMVIEKIKSERAKVSLDAGMNTIVVKDLSLNLDSMERLIKNLDTRVPQVLIEAKIVEVSSNYARDLGVQWGGLYTGGNTVVYGGTTGATTSSTTGPTVPLIGSTILFPQTGDIGRSGNAYAVNLPAAVGAGSGGALGISFGRLLGGKLSLDLQLSAMQTTGNGKILSNPKVLTMNNKEARISSGTDIPVRIVSSTAVSSVNTVGVQTISASLQLSAIPTITSDNRIVMAIKVEKAEPDFSRQVDGIPTITKRATDAQLVVSSGETVVLGGIIIKNEAESESAVPFLSKIPILGWLFKEKRKSTTEDELMVFITPTIVKEE